MTFVFLISGFALSVAFLVHRILSLRVMYNYYYKWLLSCGRLHVHVYSSPEKHHASVHGGRAYPCMHCKHWLVEFGLLNEFDLLSSG